MSVWLEWNLSKKEILKLYLDRAYMGGGNFGIGAAAKYYFGKRYRMMFHLAESAMLAGLFQGTYKICSPHQSCRRLEPEPMKF